MEAMPIATILANVGSLVEFGITWVGDYVGAIMSNPLLLMFTVTSFVGLGIGLIKRLIRL